MRGKAFAVILIIMAGCAKPAPSEDAAATDTVTGIEGVVVDAAIVPVANASVHLVEPDLRVRSDSTGMFHFDVGPGAYTLAVEKEGHLPSSTVVEVGNGTAQVQVQLERAAIIEPFGNVLQWDGVIQCAARHPQNAVAACGLVFAVAEQAGLGGPLGAVADDAEERYPEVDTPPTLAQSDMVWTSTQTLGEGLRLMFTDDHRGGADNYAVDAGPSPLSVRADNRTLMFKHLDSQGLLIRVFPGDFQGTGAGAVLMQDFTVFTSLYYNYAPPADWRFTDDNALYPPP